MKPYICINKSRLYLNQDIQVDKQGNKFRHSATEIDYSKQPIYSNEYKMYLHPTIYTFIYIKTNKFISFYFDANGKFSHKC